MKHFIVLAISLLFACSTTDSSGGERTSSEEFGGASFVATDEPQMEVLCERCKAPLSTKGSNEVIVQLMLGGVPVSGAQGRAKLWMRSMGHGTTVDPEMEELGEGRYLFSNLIFTMRGEWELQMQWEGAQGTEYHRITLDVEAY